MANVPQQRRFVGTGPTPLGREHMECQWKGEAIWVGEVQGEVAGTNLAACSLKRPLEARRSCPKLPPPLCTCRHETMLWWV